MTFPSCLAARHGGLTEKQGAIPVAVALNLVLQRAASLCPQHRALLSLIPGCLGALLGCVHMLFFCKEYPSLRLFLVVHALE